MTNGFFMEEMYCCNFTDRVVTFALILTAFESVFFSITSINESKISSHTVEALQ